jgi:AmmeMemoRadiSam system protein B
MEALRHPAVAGRFYPDDAPTLSRSVRGFLSVDRDAERTRASAVLVPHAGYMYSGAIAGATYAAVQVPSRVIVLCPNHTGFGSPRAVWHRGAWRMPFGNVPVDEPLCDALIRHARLTPDTLAHAREHAVEVHLPFLREAKADVSIAPVVLGGLSYDQCREVGEGIADAIREAAPGETGHVLIVASSDMSHYVTADVARSMDRLALDRVQALDPEGLYFVVRERRISMCGFVPTTVALVAAIGLGAKHARIVEYGNSGETSGDFDHVVGYAGAIVW